MLLSHRSINQLLIYWNYGSTFIVEPYIYDGLLCAEVKTRAVLRGKLLAAATYPAIVTVVALDIVLFLMTYVVPQVVQVFERTR